VATLKGIQIGSRNNDIPANSPLVASPVGFHIKIANNTAKNIKHDSSADTLANSDCRCFDV
jgi:hypothetical protein